MNQANEVKTAYSNYLKAKKETKAKNMAVREVKHQLEGIAIALDKAKEDLIEAKQKQRTERKIFRRILNKPLFKPPVNNNIPTAIKDSIHTFIEANVAHLWSVYMDEIETEISFPIVIKREPEE